MTFLVALGRAMIDSGASVTQVGASLHRVAVVNGVHGAAFVVLPTALFVSVPGADDVQTSVASVGGGLRLDQVDAVFRVVDAAEHGETGAAEGLARLDAARAMTPPVPVPVRLLGYPMVSAGVALILRASWTELLVATVLGAAVGLLQLHRSKVPAAYELFLPVGSALGASTVVFLLVRAGMEIDVYTPLVAPLVTFLPGALLTTAVIELATGQMMSGAGRLAQGGMHLVLLAIGVIAAAQLVGVPATTFSTDTSGSVPPFLPWLGVAVFGVGVALAYSARPASSGWIVLILYVAYAGQVVGELVLGSQLSAFTGALLMTPFAMVVAGRPSGPPTLVTFLPAFWLLVPGAGGLAGVTKYLGDNRVDGVNSLVTAGTMMIGIAFGVLLGLAAGTLFGLGAGVNPSYEDPLPRRRGE